MQHTEQPRVLHQLPARLLDIIIVISQETETKRRKVSTPDNIVNCAKVTMNSTNIKIMLNLLLSLLLFLCVYIYTNIHIYVHIQTHMHKYTYI
jgi:hypothetical protein